MRSAGRAFSRAGWFTTALGVAAAGVFVPLAAAATGTVLYVGGAGCSDSGTGTASQPYCTISAAAEATAPGSVVEVSSGTYLEAVVPPVSGTASAPITYQAVPGAAVTLTGETYGFKIRSRDWITVQGFRVQDTSSNGLYVGYSSHVVLDGNVVTRSGHREQGSNAAGIYLTAATDAVVSGNVSDDNSASGIYLTNGSTRVTVRGNEVMHNAYGWQRNGTGIDVRSPGNTIVGNQAHDNEDSGIQFYPGGDNNVVAGNVTGHNIGFTTTVQSNCSHPATGNVDGCLTGDHGIDNLRVTGNTITGNTVYENTAAGINVEGLASGTPSGFTIKNNIGLDNGLNCPNGAGGTTVCPRTQGNVRVDATSQTGVVLDRDVVWLTGPGTVMTWGKTKYASLAAFRAASGQESAGREADPRLRAPAEGDVQLLPGSGAIDMADSGASGQWLVDLAGSPRTDDPATVDTGIGVRSFDDAGALEFLSVPAAPVLQATPGDRSASLSWSAPTTATPPVTGYAVYRSVGGATAAQIATTAAGTLGYLDNGLTGWTDYTYLVTALSANGESGYSSPVTVTPTGPGVVPLPPVLEASVGDGTVTLTWVPPDPRGATITGYTVYRGTTPGTATELTTLGATSTSYSDTGLVNGTRVYYQLAASSSAGASERSDEISAVPTAMVHVASVATPLTSAVTGARLALPAGRQQGDLLVAWLTFGSGVTGVGGLTGWTQLAWSPLVDGSSSTAAAYYKVATGAETDIPITWSGSAKGVLAVADYRGVDPLNPISASAGAACDNVRSASVATPSVTSPDERGWALSLSVSRTSTRAVSDISWREDPALVERLDANNVKASSGAWLGVEIADSAGAVTTGPHRYVATASAAETHHDSALLYLKPAGGTP